MKKKCTLGGILKHKDNGYGFKVSFSDVEAAQYYKDMIFWIIKNDKVSINIEKGYFDSKEG
jgi:hypothetical protein